MASPAVAPHHSGEKKTTGGRRDMDEEETLYDMDDREGMRESIEEMARSGSLCHKINQLDPRDPKVGELTGELLGRPLEGHSGIVPPFQIDNGRRVRIGRNVFINNGLEVMSLGGVTVEDGAMLGPEVAILTVNHELANHRHLIAKPVRIGRNAWVGARATILPGISVGEGAVVAGCSVVTHDVAPYTVVAGNPARVLREIEH